MFDFNFRNTAIIIGGAICLVLWLVFLLHPVGTGQSLTIDNGDSYLHMWNLWWVKQALLVEGHSPYWTVFNGYPVKASLTYHQLILPIGLLSIPLFKMGLLAGQVLVFWQYAFPIIGYAGMIFLVRRLDGAVSGAVLSGLYLTVTPLYWQNLPRPDSLCYLLFPWLFWALLWARKRGVLAQIIPVLIASIILLMSPYFGAGLVLMWVFSLPWIQQFGFRYREYLVLVPVSLLLTAFQWSPQIVSNHPNLVDWSVVEAFSADVTYWLFPPESLWWIPQHVVWWADLWTATEPSLYIGWFTIGFVCVKWFDLTDSVRKWACLMVGGFFLLSLGPGLRILGRTYLSGWLPFGWAMHLIDSARAFRAPLRFGYFIVFFVALGLGYFYRTDGRPVKMLLAILILVELIRVPIPVRSLPASQNLLDVKQEIEAPALIPIPLTDWPTEVQYAQTVHEKKLALIGTSYGIPRLWRKIGQNPVLNALYERKPLPNTGWESLIEQGYGGVIVHHKLFPADLHGLRDQWSNKLRRRFGRPVLEADRFSVYEF